MVFCFNTSMIKKLEFLNFTYYTFWIYNIFSRVGPTFCDIHVNCWEFLTLGLCLTSKHFSMVGDFDIFEMTEQGLCIKFCVKNVKCSEVVQMLKRFLSRMVCPNQGIMNGTNVSKRAVKALKMTRELEIT